jgi:hypothetical protein
MTDYEKVLSLCESVKLTPIQDRQPRELEYRVDAYSVVLGIGLRLDRPDLGITLTFNFNSFGTLVNFVLTDYFL